MSSDQLRLIVRQKIDCLSNPQQTREANDWLMDFEKSTEAWTASETLLFETTSTYRFFGAKFLYSKIQKQSIVLDDKQKNSLRDALTQHLVRISTQFIHDIQVIRYLCLGLSALALQIGDSQVVQNTLQQLNPLVSANSTALVLFLSVLPEEAHNSQIDVSPSNRSSFITQLSGSSSQVLQFLSSLWRISQNISNSDRCRMIKCFSNWIDSTSLPLNVVLQHVIFVESILTLPSCSDEVLEQIVDMILVLVHRYQSSHMEVLLRQVIPHIVALQSRWGTLESKYPQIDAECVEESFGMEAFLLSKLFAETSEECIEIFLDLREDFGQRRLLQLLMCSCNFPFDHNVARISHKFFYDLALLIKGGNADESVRQFYVPIFLELVAIALRRLVARSQSVKDESSLDDRNDWKELILDCVDVIGPDACFSNLCLHLQNGMMQWSNMEATLFAMCVVMEQVGEECVASVLPQLVQLCCSVPSDQQLIQSTAISLLGKLCKWLVLPRFSVFIPQVTDILLKYLAVDRLSSRASISLIQLSRSCGGISLPIDMFLSALSLNLTREVELNLIEAMACSIDLLDLQKQQDLLGKLFVGIENSIVAASKSEDSKLMNHGLDKLIVISKVVHDPEILFQIFSRTWSSLTAVLANQPRESTAEKVCKCWKYIVRGAKSKMTPALPSLAEELAKGFRSLGYSAFLYCTAICISTFGLLDNGIHVQTLYGLLWSQSNAFFCKFPDVEAFNKQPDVVEEYFYMVAKALQFCPSPLVDARDEAATMLNAAVVGLQVQHREAQKGMLLVLERLVDLPRFFEASPEQSAKAKVLIGSFAGIIVGAMVRLMSAVIIAFAIEEGNGCVCDVLWETRRTIGNDNFEQLLNDAFNTLPPHAAEIANKLEVRNILCNTKSHREFVSTVDRFEVACRRNMC